MFDSLGFSVVFRVVMLIISHFVQSSLKREGTLDTLCIYVCIRSQRKLRWIFQVLKCSI